MESFGDRLKKLRGRLISQQNLAEKSGLTVATISKLERGEHQPARQTILALAGALKVPPEVLWGQSVESPADTVWVPLPRAVYDVFAARAAKLHNGDVPAYLKRLAEGTPIQIISRDDVPPDGVSPADPPPAAPTETPAPGPSPRRGRQRQPAR